MTIHAQQRAVTETGEEVTLYDNGTWKYLNVLVEEEETIIPTNPQPFLKDEKSTFLLKSSVLDIGVYLNPKLWAFHKAEDNPDAEYELQMKNGDLYGMIITEKIEIPLETLKSIALETAKAAAPDLTVIKEEYRTVNGLKVLLLQMDGTMQGIKFSYYGYYYSNPNGTVQFITYTSQNLLEEYRNECDNLLNGLSVIE